MQIAKLFFLNILFFLQVAGWAVEWVETTAVAVST